MALIGGGGAGNVAGGSNPSGTGASLNYIGDHCYAYSGSKASSGTETSFLDFTTASNSYIEAKVQPVYFGQGTNNVGYFVYFNGELVQYAEVTSGRDYTPYDVIYLIIPADTHVEIKIDNLSGGAEDAGVSLTGRVYG